MDALDQLLEEILETDASPGTLQLVLSKLKERGRTDLVIQQGRRALKTHPEHVGLRALLAEAYLESGLAARASEEMEHVLLQLEEMTVVYRRLAEVYLLQRREIEAARCLSIYLAHRPDDAEARETLDRIAAERAQEAAPGTVPATAPPESAVRMPGEEPEPLEADLEEAVAEPEPDQAPEAAIEEAEEEPEAIEEPFKAAEGVPEPPEAAVQETEAAPEPLEAALEEALEEPEPGQAPEAAIEGAEEEPEEEQDLPEIATHTLAELYADQGQIEAATETYRKILNRDPADEKARARLQELEGVVQKEAAPAPDVPLEEAKEPSPVDPERRRSEKMIAVLEQWLSRIHDSRPGTSA